jgi:hypothetical protein
MEQMPFVLVRPFLCENLSDVDTCDTTGVFGDTEAGEELGETFQHLVQVFYRDWTIATQLQELEQDLVDLSAAASYVDQSRLFGQLSRFFVGICLCGVGYCVAIEGRLSMFDMASLVLQHSVQCLVL